MKIRHPPEIRGIPPITTIITNPSSQEPIDRFECYICKIEFIMLAEVKDHLKKHSAARNRKCEICDEMLTSNEFNRHICGTGSEIQCEYCNDSFNATFKLMEHLESKHDDNKILYKCRKCCSATCGRFFDMEYLRDSHEKRRKFELTPFICDVCHKGFSAKSKLKVHSIKHSIESK